MKRWLIMFLTVCLLVSICGVLFTEGTAFGETALLLDTNAGKPLDASKGIFTALGLTTVSRSDVWSDPAKLNNIGAYRIAILHQWGGSNG